MKEIASIIGGQMMQGLKAKANKPQTAAVSFLDAARGTLLASQAAVVEKGSLKDLGLRKNQEIKLDLFETEEEEDDLLSLIKRFQKILERF